MVLQARSDEFFMAAAFREAERGFYTARPNPRVGCVLVKDGEIISRGFHLQTGTGHAEANAIRLAQQDLQGATAYVTLEPCSYVGRTPSCAHALIDHGIARVVYAVTDPHPGNRGLGLQKLRDAGIEVVGPVMESAGIALNPGHIKKYTSGLPLVRLKLAQSLDGKTALANGASQWITGPEARRDVQKLRARSCAVVTGIGTVLADDPGLNVRADELGTEYAELAAKIRRPIVVLDSQGRFPPGAKLAADTNLIVAVAQENPALGVPQTVMPLDANGQIDLRQLLQFLVEKEDCSEVLFECGPTLAGSLLQAEWVDEIVLYVAPKLMGHEGRGLVNLPQIQSMDQVPDFTIQDVRRVGADLRLTLVKKG